MSIAHETAWDAVPALSDALAPLVGEGFRAAYVVGEPVLRTGGDASDLAVTLVLAPDGDADLVEPRIAAAARTANACWTCLHEDDLRPPFAPERETAPEVVRILDDGTRVAGDELRDHMVRPSRDDLLAYVRHLDRLVRATLLRPDADEVPPGHVLYDLVAAACRHWIFTHERMLMWRKTDALTGFCMGNARHPATPLIRRVLRTPAARLGDVHTRADVGTFWRAVHEKIAA